MKELLTSSSFFGITLTIGTYMIALAIQRRFKSDLLNPLLLAIAMTIAVVLICDIGYDSYNASAKYLSFLLTPATVCLAVPLYEKIDLLKKNAKAIFIGIFSGVMTSILVIFALSKIFSFTKEEFATFLPKSITTAIGMSVAEELGGYVSIAVAAIILTGVLGNMICVSVLKIFHIDDSIAKGVAIGSASHAIGTSRAMQIGETEGAISSLSIVTAGIMTVILANIIISLY